MRKIDFDEFCVGTVTIITTDVLIITGSIKDDRHDHDDDSIKTENKVIVEEKDEFITVTLTVPVLKIPGNATFPGLAQTFFNVGDTIRINVANIVTVGPSHPT